MKEVNLKRFAGPFDEIPFKHFVQSPIGLVPKAGDQMRLIFHLSYDFGNDDRHKSINFHTPEELCSVKYNDLDHAIKNCLYLLEQMGPETTIFFGCTDIRSAFRIVPLKISQFCLLIMMAEHPVEQGKICFFVDKCLPFGASISCALFQKVSDALKWLTEYKIRQKRHLTNYLDDFLFLAACAQICNHYISQFLKICKTINCTIADDKTEWGTTRIVFLGVLLDGHFTLLVIPEEKRTKALNAVQWGQ